MPKAKSQQFEEELFRELSSNKEQLAQKQGTSRNFGADILKGIGEVKEFLSQILDKLSHIDESIKESNKDQSTTPSQVSETIKIMQTTADSLKNIEGIFNQRPQEVDPTILIDSTELSFKREAEKIKQTFIQKWNHELKLRRIYFWNMLKNKNKADIYLNWLESSPIVLPRKLQFKEISEEPEQQRRRREKLAMDQFQAEIDLLQMRAKANEEKCDTVDLEMEQLIKTKANGNIAKNLLFLWNTDCKQEEDISVQRWSKSSIWFDKYKTEFHETVNNQNPFVKTMNNSTARPSNRRQFTERRNARNNYRQNQYQNRYEGNRTDYTYERNVRPQIPFKETYNRRNFSNWQTNRRNEEAVDNFRETQNRFLYQRRPYRQQP